MYASCSVGLKSKKGEIQAHISCIHETGMQSGSVKQPVIQTT